MLAALSATAAAAPSAVSTFHSIGLYWSPEGGSDSNAARVQFRPAGSPEWRQGLDLWFDARNNEYRGSLVELEPGTSYEVRLALASGQQEILKTQTWSEKFPIKKTVQVAAGKRLVIGPEDSGDEKGYVLFTAPAGQNVIDGNDTDDACVVIQQGAHHVIVRGLVLKDCKRFGVLIQRQGGDKEASGAAQTTDVVIEGNEISGWGGYEIQKPNSRLADSDGAIHCNYYREKDDAKRPDRIIVQGNRIRDPRHSANPWQSEAHGHMHPYGPLGMMFDRCGSNHVIRYNEISSKNGNRFKDGIGGADNFSAAGFPWADSDIYGNRIAEVYDDGIEAEGGNRNVRIWNNHLKHVYVAIANATVATGPIYVWRNVAEGMARMYQPEGFAKKDQRGPFIKAGSKRPEVNGGRAYYFHNTGPDAGAGIARSGGPAYNFVARNNKWPASRVNPADGPFDLKEGRSGEIPNFSDRDASAIRSGASGYKAGQPGG
jgi:hypothetical protein